MFKKISLALLIIASLIALPSTAVGQSGTISQLTQWITSGGYIKAASSTAGVWVPSLGSPSAPCVTVGTTGKFGTSTCGSGGGGSQTPWTSAINGGGFALTNAGAITGTTLNATSTTVDSILKGLQFTNATGTSATTTSFAISSILNSLLWTNGTGGVVSTSTGLIGAGTGISVTGSRYALGGTLTITNDGVTSISATSPLVNNVSVGAVSLTCPTCSTFTYPFPSNATTTALAFPATSLTLSKIGAATYSTVQHLMNLFNSPGNTSGGTFSTSSGNVAVAAGTGLIKATDSNVAEMSFFDYSASSTVTIGATTTRYIGVEYNSGTPRVVHKAAQTWDYDTDFPLGTAVSEGSTIWSIYRPWETGDAIADILERFDSTAYITRDNRTGGLILSNTGTRNIAITAGALLSRVSEYTIAAIDTSVSGSCDAYYNSGANFQRAQTTWNNSQYDNAGTLTSITALAYTSRWFYVMSDGTCAYVYGTSQDLDLSDILNEGAPATLPARISETGLLIGRFIIRASATTPTVTQSAFGTAFTAGTVTSHTGLADLAWSLSNHTGIANGLAAFDSAGAAYSFSTSTFNVGNFTATNATTTSFAITGLASPSNPCLKINTIGAIATTTCGSGSSATTWVSEAPSGTINSSNTSFTLGSTPDANSLSLLLNGLYQTVTTDYTLSGVTVTMLYAPLTNSVLTAKYTTSGSSWVQGAPTGTINGSNAVFTLSATPAASSLAVYLNGAYQTFNVDYTLSGTTVTFTNAPLTNSILFTQFMI